MDFCCSTPPTVEARPSPTVVMDLCCATPPTVEMLESATLELTPMPAVMLILYGWTFLTVEALK